MLLSFYLSSSSCSCIVICNTCVTEHFCLFHLCKLPTGNAVCTWNGGWIGGHRKLIVFSVGCNSAVGQQHSKSFFLVVVWGHFSWLGGHVLISQFIKTLPPLDPNWLDFILLRDSGSLQYGPLTQHGGVKGKTCLQPFCTSRTHFRTTVIEENYERRSGGSW